MGVGLLNPALTRRLFNINVSYLTPIFIVNTVQMEKGYEREKPDYYSVHICGICATRDLVIPASGFCRRANTRLQQQDPRKLSASSRRFIARLKWSVQFTYLQRIGKLNLSK